MSEEEERKGDGEADLEEESSDDYDTPIPMDEDDESGMSCRACIRAFLGRQGEWEVIDILKLVWMIRLCMAPVFGFVSGFCRIPTVVGQILFVWLCSKIPTMIILRRTGVDPYALVGNPARFMRYGTISVYLTFIVCSIGGRVCSSMVFGCCKAPAPSQQEL